MESDSTSAGYSARKALGILIVTPIVVTLVASSHQLVLAIFFTALLLWFTEAIPLPITALFIPILVDLFGLAPAAKIFAPFGNDILFLFLGCFLMGLSMAKYGLDRRVAYWLLAHCLPGDSLLSINLVTAATTFFVSMWISNTAATAVMSAVTIGILDSLGNKLDDEQLRRASVRLLLSCAFAASIGGLATPIGSPPNLIALKFLASNGIEIPFLRWMMFGLPVSVIMFGALFLIFEWRYPLRGVRVENASANFGLALRELGPMTRGEKQIGVVFILAITLWIIPGFLKSIFPDVGWIVLADSRLSMSVVGLFGGLVLFLLPLPDGSGRIRANLEWSESRAIEWGTILLFGGGLALGNLLEQSGAAKDFGELIFRSGLASLPLLIGTIIVTGILLSEFASNTAAAAILIPLVIGAAKSISAGPALTEALVLCVAFSASFGFMLPVSTPPNAIVYGTGRVSSRDMLRTGMWFDMTGALIVAGFTALMML